MRQAVRIFAAALALLAFAPPASAADAPAQLDSLRRSDGARIVPDRFLRRWDPITVFFPRDVGPFNGGSEDDPGRLVAMDPPQPGAWTWLSPRALQFRPAEPWRPLRRVRIVAENQVEARLIPLLPAPVSATPDEGGDGSADLSRIGLTFPEPVDVKALERLISIETRPLPGISAEGGRVLKAPDLSVKPVERAARSDQQTYLVTLAEPAPDGRMLILRLNLSDEDGLDEPIYELRLKSAAAFAVTKSECGRGFSDEIEDGVLRCTSYGESTYDGDDSDDGPTDYMPGWKRSLILSFSGQVAPLDEARAREAFRITPPVDDLVATFDNRRVVLSGRFKADTLYDLTVVKGALKDKRDRPLAEAATRRFSFKPEAASLVWDAGQGVVERLGPQMVPLRGRGYEKADIRIHPIDPMSRDFWPFPTKGLETDDDAPPPLPGKEPSRWASQTEEIGPEAMAARIKALGSPAVSELVSLPIRRSGLDAKFGLDLRPFFAKISGAEQSGTYLVGVRPIGETKRRWMRAQVTDLVLSTVEEPERVRFVVTSLGSARPVVGADIRLEGLGKDREGKDQVFQLARGTTDQAGGFVWSLPTRPEAQIKRIVVVKGTDTLVLEPGRGPSEYAKENWTKPEEDWLSWTVDPEVERAEKPKTVCHVFTERPIYRPEEPVLVKGIVRTYLGGALSYAKGEGTLIFKGPSDQEWPVRVTLDSIGGFHHKFDVETPATGDYTVRFEPDGAAEVEQPDAAEEEEDSEEEADASPETDAVPASGGKACATFPFKKEAYRLPTFEALLTGPGNVPLDRPFDVDLLGRYFAGGLVSERPVKWRVTQFPHTWSPPGREGFLFSTDQRFSGETQFRSTPVLERDGLTDQSGSARITLDPTIEPTAQPRRYQIEATVTGEDDIQVRSIQSTIALPPFALGVRVPRYAAQIGAIDAQILALSGDGKTQARLEMTVRFVRRNWISTLQASDFAQGAAKYVTQTVDETLEERRLTSGIDPQSLRFDVKEAGVYLVEVEASDRIGRRQSVKVDFFVGGGDARVTWPRPPAETVAVTTEKDSYAPGETAVLILQSPFATARALAIVEEPDGRYRYDWLDIVNGYGRYSVALRKEQMPKLPVHFLVMRGRLPAPPQAATAPFDQTKPVTVAATKWVTVTPVKHTATLSIENPLKARPAQEIEVTLRLSDDLGKPMAGEATFWMVDQAVLSLAREQPLNPVPHFVVQRPTTMAARDTRNMAFGIIPLEEVPGGDAPEDDWGIENISVRKNFTPVPIYEPRVRIGPDGVAKIKFRLPDTLTVYKLRAKVVAGPDRFGFAIGEMAIRQDLVAQPALPRFVRPGDRFEAGVIGRIVEGPGGAGRAGLSVEGMAIDGGAEQRLAWVQNRPERADFPVTTLEPRDGRDRVKIRFSILRDADRATDVVEADLPVRPDRSPLRRREIVDLAPGRSLVLRRPRARMREGSASRSVTIASDPAATRLIGGLNYLFEYPYGCTEQKIALASAALALKPFGPILASAGLLQNRLASDVRAAARGIEQAIDDDGLVAFWPKAKGNVSLTAWSYGFLIRAREAGEQTDAALIERLGKALKMALRSDYALLLSGEELRERMEALTALGEGGALDDAYVAELSRRALAMPNAALAQATAAAAKIAGDDRRQVATLLEALWSRVILRNRDGQPVYGGLAGERANPMILPSETRSLSEIVRAVATAAPEDSRLTPLRDGLIRLGEGDGWGDTNANAAAIRALAASWLRPAEEIPLVLTTSDGGFERIALTAETPLARRSDDLRTAWTLANPGPAAAVALVETRYMPAEPGFRAAPISEGLSLTRALHVVRPDSIPEPTPLSPDQDGAVQVQTGTVIEEAAELAVSEDLTHVAIRLPLAAGMEPLNPRLATATADAAPSSGPTLAPTWTAFADDHVLYAYDSLPKGIYKFFFRTRALIPGAFTQPPGEAQTMYRNGIYGASGGVRIVVSR